MLLTIGEPVPYVVEQLVHTDPKGTLGIYARLMHRSDGDRERLALLVDGVDLPRADKDPARGARWESRAETHSAPAKPAPIAPGR